MSQVIGTTTCPRCRERGHDSRGDNLVLYEDGGAHCFACKLHKFPKHYNGVKDKKVDHEQTPLLPSDFEREVPGVAWKWLLQYGLPISYWKPFVGWSEKDMRLVFTVGDPLAFSIGRAIDPDNKRKWFVYGDSHQRAASFGCVDVSKKVVLVEDIVSAHKVGQVTLSVPIFGTVTHPCHLKLLRYFGLPVVLWLDKDQEGLTYKKANTISMYTGLPCQVVHTDKDPKLLTTEEIKTILTT